MDKITAQNALNFFLSDRFTFSGTDFPPLLEIVKALQEDIIGHTPDKQSGDTKAEDGRPRATKGT